MILVTGATGTIGSALVRLLLARGEEVTAVTRDPAKIEPRPGLTVSSEIGKARAVFLLAPAGPQIPHIDRNFVEKAKDAERLVKLSAIVAPEAGLNAWHQPGEDALRQSGQEWTILRPTTFASNSLAWRDDIRNNRPILNIFGDGRQGIVDPEDVAAVAAEVLTGAGHHGKTNTLTGPELLTVPEQAAQLAAVLRTAITTVDVPPAREHFPPEIADMTLAGALLVRDGGNAILTDDVEKVLGRRPGTYRAWAERQFTAG